MEGVLKAVILAAGIGSRLGRQLPKGLTSLPIGDTLLGNQIKLLRKVGIKEIYVVVGFKKELIMEAYPHVFYIYNANFHITNTAKSLLLAFEMLEADDIIWLNADLFLEKKVLELVLSQEGNIVAVNNNLCGEEEVKYRLDDKGNISEISKELLNAEGEAVGVNKISQQDFNVFLEALRKCEAKDFFEKAIELSIKEFGLIFRPLDISSYKCMEVDFQADLLALERLLK
jgi:choline kinase